MGSVHGGTCPSVFTVALRSSHAQKNRAEIYVRDCILGTNPSDLSSRADALSTYQVDPLSHRATKPKKKKKKKTTTTKNLNKTWNLSECEDSLASTSDEEQQQEEVLQGDVEDLSAGKRGARRRVRSRQFNITLKRATQTDRYRIKLLPVSEEGKLLRKYEVSITRD